MLKKKTASVSYQFVYEGVSADEWCTTHVNTEENSSDILTKNLPSGEGRYKKGRIVLCDIYLVDHDIKHETNP